MNGIKIFIIYTISIVLVVAIGVAAHFRVFDDLAVIIAAGLYFIGLCIYWVVEEKLERRKVTRMLTGYNRWAESVTAQLPVVTPDRVKISSECDEIW